MARVQTAAGSNFPEFKQLLFDLNPVTGYYNRVEDDVIFPKVPSELRVEETKRTDQIHAGLLVRSRMVEGKHPFFTGIIRTRFDGWFFGDFYEIRNGIKRNSFILFHFSGDHNQFEMFFFNHLKLYPPRRESFIKNFVLSIK